MRSTNSVSARLTAWVMALCPLALAILCHTGFRSVPLSIALPSQPALSFIQYAVDLRKIQPATVVEANYVFHNHGSGPVHITKLEPSCGCLTPKLQGARDDVIAAGGQGRVIIRMQPANATPGPHDNTLKREIH